MYHTSTNNEGEMTEYTNQISPSHSIRLVTAVLRNYMKTLVGRDILVLDSSADNIRGYVLTAFIVIKNLMVTK